MFYSNDLLGKKSPLGAIWIAAHQPRKLNKARLMSINISETCSRIMDPEVPQALRLQAILVGGVVFVFSKQLGILLEDAQEMLRRLRVMSAQEAAKVTLEEGKRQAKAEAITLGVADLDLAGPLDSLFPVFHTQLVGDLRGPGAAAELPQHLGDDLFAMPTLPEGDDEGAYHRTGGAAGGSRGRGRGAAGQATEGGAGGSKLALEQEEQELDIALDLHRHDLHLMDAPETFDVPDLGFGLPGADGLLEVPSMEAVLPDDLLPVPSALLRDAGEQQPVLLEGEEVQQGEAEQRQQQPCSQTPQTSSEKPDSSAGAAPRTQRRRGRKRSTHSVVVDDLEQLLISGGVYRQWQTDASDLVMPRPAPRAEGPASKAAALGLLGAGPATASLLASGAWPAALQELFHRDAPPATTTNKFAWKGRSHAKQEQPEEDEQEEQAHLAAEAAGGALPDYQPGPGEYDGEQLLMEGGLLPAWEGLVEGEEPFNPFRRSSRPGAGLRAGEEAEDEDIETERLRAALNNPSDPGYDLLGTALGLTPASLGAPGASGHTLAGSKRGASGGLLRRDSEGAHLGAAGLLSEHKSSDRRDRGGRLADLHEGVPLEGGDLDLAGMLPVVGEEEPLLEGADLAGTGAVPGSCGAKRQRLGAGAGTSEGHGVGACGSGDGAGASLAAGTGTYGTGGFGTLSQFELLEESNKPTQMVAAPNASRHTHALINVLRGRFNALESQGSEVAQLSLFQLCERLTRQESAKLFSQFLVLASNDFVRASQQEPYSDILLSRGAFL